MKKYSTLIFDLDDTLINNNESVKFAFRETAIKLNIPYNEKIFHAWLEFEKKYWHAFEMKQMDILSTITNLDDKIAYVRAKRFILFFKSLNLTMDQAMKINDYYCCLLGVNIVEMNKASETLEELSKNHEILIATNGPKEAALSKVKKANIDNYISFIVSSEEVGFSKPNEEFFEYLYSKIENKNKDNMLLIGDSLTTDILGGMKNGIDTCWYNPKNLPLPEEYKPTHTINCLSQLKRRL